MKKGQVLIEVIIAVSIALVALIGIVQIANKSVNNSGQSRRQAEATALGTEAMEWIVAQKSLGWESFSGHADPWGVEYCFSVTPITNWTGVCGTLVGSPAIYDRRATLRIANDTEIEITVIVNWTEGGRAAQSYQTRTVGRY